MPVEESVCVDDRRPLMAMVSLADCCSVTASFAADEQCQVLLSPGRSQLNGQVRRD
jgi:hypothetical protein